MSIKTILFSLTNKMVNVILRYKKKENSMKKYEVGDLVKLKHKPRVFKHDYAIGIIKGKKWNKYANRHLYVVVWNTGKTYMYRDTQLVRI